jgi:hypothetical protein
MRILLLLLLFKLATGTILEVPADYPTVQAALDATQSGDTVLVAPGTWHGNLVTPDRELTLASHFLLSRDSLDIQQTILDGDSLDSVVRIENSEGNCLSMTGFSVENGLATHAGIPDGTGGGIHLVPGSCATLEHLVIQGNHSSIYGAAFKVYLFHENQPACTLKHIRINHNPQYYGVEDIVQMHFWSNGPIVVEDLQIDGQGYVGQGINVWGTPLIAEDVTLRNTSYGRFSLMSSSDASYRNITMEQCRSVRFGLTAADDSLHVSDVQIRNCMWGDWWSTGVSIGSSPLVLDSLVFENNRIVKGAETSGLSSLIRIASWPRVGHFENVVVRENMVGDSIPPGAGEVNGYATWVRLLDMVGVKVKGLKVLNNVIHDAYRGPSLRYNRDGMFALFQGGGLNTVFEDAEFANNLVVDHGEFSPNDPDGYHASQGRSIRFLLGRYNEEGIPTDTTLIRNLVFRNERMPNHPPETGGLGNMSVGSVLQVKTTFFSSVFKMENVIVRDCDDGGIYMFLEGQNSTVRNIQVENVARRGLCVEDWNAYEGTHEISNVWISGVQEQDMYLPYPYTWCYQQPMSVYGSGELIRVSNVTIEACSTNVFMLSEALWDNCTITNNQFNYFYSPMESCCDESYFRYSNLPVEVAGEHLMIDVDPAFDSQLGPPYLDPSSPLIDAGHPDLLYLDVVDPDNPGWALLPSQGGLRNDIGYTGGPYAAIPDTSWVHLDPDVPERRPIGFELGNPYPNPFNARAQVSFQLEDPAEITLKVHNILGQEVASLVHGIQPAGLSTITIDGSAWASGVYLLTLRSDREVRTKKLLLLK